MLKISIFYLVIAPTLAGVGAVAVLVNPGSSTTMLVGAIAAGFVAAIPAAWYVSKQIA